MRPATIHPYRTSLTTFAVTVLIALAVAPRVHAQTWNELGDAGSLVATAQVTIGSGPLQFIQGGLASPADVDVYCIHLAAVPPAGLPIVQLNCVVTQGPNIYLFDSAGNGVFANTSCSAGEKTLLAPSVSLLPGDYYVAVSYFGNDPQSAAGPIWAPGVGQRAPDGPGAAGVLTGWAGTAIVQPINPYTIALAFTGYCGAPTPASAHTWGTLKSIYR